MKVALVCPYDWSHPGGVRSHIRGLAAALGRRGVATEIIAPASRPEPEIFVAGRPLAVPFNGSVARLCFSAAAARRIRKRLKGENFDLAHLHEPGIPSVSLLALKAAGVPSVATFHASAPRSRGYRAAAPVLRPVLAKLRGRIAVSQAALELISAHFPGEYEIVPNGVEVKLWAEAAPDLEWAKLKPLVVFVGRPEPRKGLKVLLEAMEIVRSLTEANLLVVGPAPSRVPEWVHAPGPVGAERLPSLVKAGDVLCAPSLGGESFGIVLAEAMAAGVPVVCSDLPGYKEAAAGAVLETPAGDARKTAEAIIAVLADPATAAKLSELGRCRAAELDWDVLVDKVLDCYKMALS